MIIYKLNFLFLFLFLFFLLSSCQNQKIKNSGRKNIYTIKERLNNLETVRANNNERFRAIELKIDIIEGKIETINHQLSNNYITKEELQNGIGQEIGKINNVLNSLVTSLTKNTKKNKTKKINHKKTINKDIDTQYKYARKLHQTHKINKAIMAYQKIVGTNMKWYDERSRFFIGSALYDIKKYKKSIVKLENFLHKYQNSKFAPTAILLQIKSLIKINKKKSAKIVIHELLNTYPNTSQAIDAKKLLKKL